MSEVMCQELSYASSQSIIVVPCCQGLYPHITDEETGSEKEIKWLDQDPQQETGNISEANLEWNYSYLAFSPISDNIYLTTQLNADI